MARLILCALMSVGCGVSAHWEAQAGAVPYADGKCAALADSAADAYDCKGEKCWAEYSRRDAIYRECMAGSGYLLVQDRAQSDETVSRRAREPQGWGFAPVRGVIRRKNPGVPEL